MGTWVSVEESENMPRRDEEPVCQDVPDNGDKDRGPEPAEPSSDGNRDVEGREGLNIPECRIDDETQPEREVEAGRSNEVGRNATCRRPSRHHAHWRQGCCGAYLPICRVAGIIDDGTRDPSPTTGWRQGGASASERLRPHRIGQGAPAHRRAHGVRRRQRRVPDRASGGGLPGSMTARMLRVNVRSVQDTCDASPDTPASARGAGAQSVPATCARPATRPGTVEGALLWSASPWAWRD